MSHRVGVGGGKKCQKVSPRIIWMALNSTQTLEGKTEKNKVWKLSLRSRETKWLLFDVENDILMRLTWPQRKTGKKVWKLILSFVLEQFCSRMFWHLNVREIWNKSIWFYILFYQVFKWYNFCLELKCQQSNLILFLDVSF
jgi:hypothetical protein